MVYNLVAKYGLVVCIGCKETPRHFSNKQTDIA